VLVFLSMFAFFWGLIYAFDMKIIVAGGAGFLGVNLIERLLNDGHEVVCVDNFITGFAKNIERFLGNSRFSCLEHDVIEPLDGFEFSGVNVVFNFASPATPAHYMAFPLETLYVNSVGVKNLLELAERFGAKFIQASTSEIYGNPLVHPQVEGYFGNVNPIGPRSCYDEGKRFAESLCVNFKDRVDVKIARIFNVYGPYMSLEDQRVMPSFISRALNNEDLIIQGDGEQTRSFCYVDDFIDGILALMNTPKGFFGPLNIGNEYEISINQLADLTIQLTGASSKLSYVDLPQDDPLKRRPDLGLARKYLNYVRYF